MTHNMSIKPGRDTTSELSGWFEPPYGQFLRKYGTAVVDAQAIREVMGVDVLRRVLHYVYVEQEGNVVPGPYLVLGYRDYAQIHEAIRDIYGQASHGILNRIGRITFRHFVGEQVDQMSAIGIALRLMPLQARKIFILRVVARTMSESNHHDTAYLREGEGRLMLIDTNSPACHSVSAKAPICWHTIGFIEEALQWATARDFKVEEVSCRAQGNTVCTFAIAREPGVPLHVA